MLEEKYDGHLHFVHGDCTNVDALAAAHADTADRVLILPYTTWQDYRVRNHCINHNHSWSKSAFTWNRLEVLTYSLPMMIQTILPRMICIRQLYYLR